MAKLKGGGGSGSSSTDSDSDSGSSSDSSADGSPVEPAASPPVKDVSTDPGTSGEDIERMATGGGEPDQVGDDRLEAPSGGTSPGGGGGGSSSDGPTGGDGGGSNTDDGTGGGSTGSAPDQVGDDRLDAPGGGSPGGGGGGSSSDGSTGNGGGSNGGSNGDTDSAGREPDRAGDDRLEAPSSGTTPGDSGGSREPGEDWDPRPDQYQDETSVGSGESEREVYDVTTGDARDVSNVVGVDESTVEQIDEQFPHADIGTDDLQYQGGELQLTPEAQQEVRDARQDANRVSTGGQFGEERLEDEVEGANPGVDVDVGRSADDSFAVDVVDTPESEGDQWVSSGGQLGEQLRREEAEQQAREQVGEQVNEQFPNADLEAGEDFTTTVEQDGDEIVVSAELTDSGRKQIAQENAPLQGTPLEGVTEFGAGVNYEYEEFRRGAHDTFEDTVRGAADHDLISPLNFPVDFEGNEYEQADDASQISQDSIAGRASDWAGDQVDSASDWAVDQVDNVRANSDRVTDIDGPSSRDVLAAAGAAVVAPEPTSSASGAVVGGAALVGLGAASLVQDPDETRTDAELPVSDPTQQRDELDPEEFDGGVTEIEVGETNVTEVEPGDTVTTEIGVPKETSGEVGVVETGAAGTDTGTGRTPGDNPFSPGESPQAPTIEDVEDPAVSEDDGYDQRRDDPLAGTVTEGEVGGETSGDESFADVEEPAVSEDGATDDMFGDVGNGAIGNARNDAVGDVGAHTDSFGLSEGLSNVSANVLGSPTAGANAGAAVNATPAAFSSSFSTPTAFGDPTGYGGDFGTPTGDSFGNDFGFNYDFGFGNKVPRKRPRLRDDSGGFGLGDGNLEFGLGGADSRGGPATNWFNETVATSATEGTETFAPADDSGMFGAAVDADAETRDEIDSALEFFRG